LILFHPDFTVGSGIEPDQSRGSSAEPPGVAGLDSNGALTAGQEFHLTPKILYVVIFFTAQAYAEAPYSVQWFLRFWPSWLWLFWWHRLHLICGQAYIINII
jgi:hypothetical protein